MNKRFKYENWYDKQNMNKSNLLYERLTTKFVGRGLLNEQESAEMQKAAQQIMNYDLTSNKELMDKTKDKLVGPLSFLGIDFGTTEGKSILDHAARFVLNHLVDIQYKDDKKEVQPTSSTIGDFADLLIEIIKNAAKQNVELFKQFSSIPRAKAGAEIIGKRIGKAGEDIGEFGGELARTGKQAWADIKSKLFEAAPAAAASGAAVIATDVAAGTIQAAQAVAPQVMPIILQVPAAAGTIGTAGAAGGGFTAASVIAWSKAAAAFGVALMSLSFATVIGIRGTRIVNDILGTGETGTKKLRKETEKLTGEKSPGLFGGSDEEEQPSATVKAPRESRDKKGRPIILINGEWYYK